MSNNNPYFKEKETKFEYLELPNNLIFKIEKTFDYFTGKTALFFHFNEWEDLTYFFDKRRGAYRIILHEKIAGTNISAKIEIIAEFLSYNTDYNTCYILI